MFLGIDIGTSSVKTVLVDEDENVVAQASSPLEVDRPRPLFSEQDPEMWWQAAISAVGALPEKQRRAVQAIGLSGQMHGATLLDSSDRPLRPAILWNDGRSARECIELESLEPRARAITGNIVMPGFTAPKLLWVRHNQPEIFRRTASVLLPKDFVRLKLTGEKVSDMSDASGTSWMEVAKRDWSDEMLAATGLDRSHMPLLVEGSAPSGILRQETADLLRVPRVVVAGGGGDNAASAVGMGVVKPGEAFLSLGTSGVLFVATDRFRPNANKAAHAFCHCIPSRWHQMAVLLTAASALDWVMRLTGRSNLEEVLAAAEARGLHSGSPFFLPYLSGERTPHNDPHSRGVFFGMTSDTTGADLAVAVLEGVAFAFADGLDVLVEDGGEIGDISVIGGGARSSYWGQLLAAALNRPLTYRRGGEIGAAFGAARLARMALSGEAPESVCSSPAVKTIVEPDEEMYTLFANRRKIFTQLYCDLKNTFQEFSR
ncbi:MAG: xylulokinase [Terracidiphilus sp.]